MSAAFEELITKDVPAEIEAVGALRVPAVPPGVLAVKKILEDAVTAVVETVTDPAVMATEVPIEALEPVAMLSLLPAVPRTRLPFVAVIAPSVAVSVVEAVREPVMVELPVIAAPPAETVRPVAAVIVVVEAIEPGAMKVLGTLKVIV